MKDEITLIVGGKALAGWKNARVTLGIERCPNDFELSMTERLPGANDTLMRPGDACTVMLGKEQILDGYIERLTPFISGNQHTVYVSGRGRCADLVDCAAEWPGGQIVSASALSVAEKLAAPYGIKVSALADPGAPLPKLIVNVGETAFEVIERVCRFSALLPYEDSKGNLVLNRVANQQAASGFKEGVNVKAASITYAVDQQYSEYMVVRMAMDALSDAGDAGNVISTVSNPAVQRHRRRVIVAEGGDPGINIAMQRGLWESSRRYGRSIQLRLSTDSWLDASGKLYAPNTMVNIDLPSLKAVGKRWLISEVSFRSGEGGTTCDLLIMPPEAFLPQPISATSVLGG